MPTRNLPARLCRYYSFRQPEWVKPIFTENRIFFPCAKDFNDPFDSQLRCSASGTDDEKIEWIASKIKKRNPNLTRNERLDQAQRLLAARPKEALQQSVDEMVDMAARNFGVLSMSSKNDDLLMWAHYADKHQGFCLEFDTHYDFFGGAVQVRYEEKYLKQNFFRRSTDEVTLAHSTKGKPLAIRGRVAHFRPANQRSGIRAGQSNVSSGIFGRRHIRPTNDERE